MTISPSAAAQAISARWRRVPRAALILGSGLGNLASRVEPEAVIPYAEIPGFPRSTALGHAGRLVCGTLHGTTVATLEGRCHLYEGYTREQIALPVCALAELGAEVLIVTNASGGLNPSYVGGDIMLIESHIDLMFRGVAGGVGRDRSVMYDASLINLALSLARRENFVAHRGVYAALAGPNYETRAEYRLLRRIGADTVGMSTVPEVLAAASCGLRVLAISTITNVACPDAPCKATGDEVIAIAERAAPKVRKLVEGVLSRLNPSE
jgi:purine-nucleoside phosphorylase